MTSDEDIARVHAVLRTALAGLLSSSVSGEVHWQRALTPPANQEYTRPFISIQLRRPGEVKSWIGGEMEWRGEVLIWCVAVDQGAAEALARTAAAAIPETLGSVTDPGGGAAWDLATRGQAAPASVPTLKQASTVLAYRMTLERRAS